jgi:hypothetical protein
VPNDELKPNLVERPDCHHMQVIMARPSLNLSDYNQRLVPELQEAIKQPCEQCEKEKAELAKQKLIQEMEGKAGKK